MYLSIIMYHIYIHTIHIYCPSHSSCSVQLARAHLLSSVALMTSVTTSIHPILISLYYVYIHIYMMYKYIYIHIIYLSIYLEFYLSIHASILKNHPCIDMYPYVYLSICRYLSIYL